MNTILWIFEFFLAIVFGYSGIMKSCLSREKLVRLGQTGVDGLSYPLIRFIGITEVFGTVGIIVPWATGILPILTPITAVCFAIIMVLASQIHYKWQEFKAVFLNVTVFLISVFIAYTRFLQLK